jgi:hypothetical protein
MRTAAIGMYFTHYITLREQPPTYAAFKHYNREPTQLSRRDAAVLHYKDINQASGSVFGTTLPLNPRSKEIECGLIPAMDGNITAARVLDSLTKLALPYLERNYISQLTEIYAFGIWAYLSNNWCFDIQLTGFTGLAERVYFWRPDFNDVIFRQKGELQSGLGVLRAELPILTGVPFLPKKNWLT